MKYIDADKLIAEIEKRINWQRTCIKNEYRLSGKAEEEIIFEYEQLLKFITSFQQEQPEIDLEKEYKQFINCDSGRSMYDCARHFYELGLNAKKEN